MSVDALMWFGVICSAAFCALILAWVARCLFFMIIDIFANLSAVLWRQLKQAYKNKQRATQARLGEK